MGSTNIIYTTTEPTETNALLDLNYSEKYIDEILCALFKAQAEKEEHVTYTFNKDASVTAVDFTVKCIRKIFPNAIILSYTLKNLEKETLEMCVSIDL